MHLEIFRKISQISSCNGFRSSAIFVSWGFSNTSKVLLFLHCKILSLGLLWWLFTLVVMIHNLGLVLSCTTSRIYRKHEKNYFKQSSTRWVMALTSISRNMVKTEFTKNVTRGHFVKLVLFNYLLVLLSVNKQEMKKKKKNHCGVWDGFN